MKPIYEKLCRIIIDLDIISEMLDFLSKELEIAEPLPLDDYLEILLASERIREAIEFLGRILKETESVNATT